jgi:hypothetical protein
MRRRRGEGAVSREKSQERDKGEKECAVRWGTRRRRSDNSRLAGLHMKSGINRTSTAVA